MASHGLTQALEAVLKADSKALQSIEELTRKAFARLQQYFTPERSSPQLVVGRGTAEEPGKSRKRRRDTDSETCQKPSKRASTAARVIRPTIRANTPATGCLNPSVGVDAHSTVPLLGSINSQTDSDSDCLKALVRKISNAPQLLKQHCGIEPAVLIGGSIAEVASNDHRYYDLHSNFERSPFKAMLASLSIAIEYLQWDAKSSASPKLYKMYELLQGNRWTMYKKEFKDRYSNFLDAKGILEVSMRRAVTKGIFTGVKVLLIQLMSSPLSALEVQALKHPSLLSVGLFNTAFPVLFTKEIRLVERLKYEEIPALWKQIRQPEKDSLFAHDHIQWFQSCWRLYESQTPSASAINPGATSNTNNGEEQAISISSTVDSFSKANQATFNTECSNAEAGVSKNPLHDSQADIRPISIVVTLSASDDPDAGSTGPAYGDNASSVPYNRWNTLNMGFDCGGGNIDSSTRVITSPPSSSDLIPDFVFDTRELFDVFAPDLRPIFPDSGAFAAALSTPQIVDVEPACGVARRADRQGFCLGSVTLAATPQV